MAPRVRVFVALTFSDTETERLDELRGFLGARSLGRVPPHVTLLPPVERSVDEVWGLVGHVAEVAWRTAPFPIATRGFSYFVNRRVSGVLPVEEGAAGLAALRAALGVRDGSRAFVPHVTVADGIVEEAARCLRSLVDEYRFVSAAPELSVLVADLRDPRRRWEPLVSVLLGQGGPRRRSHLACTVMVARGAPTSSPNRSRAHAVWALGSDGAPRGWCEVRMLPGSGSLLGPVVLVGEESSGFGLDDLLVREALELAPRPVLVHGSGPWDEWDPTEIPAAACALLGLDQGITWKALSLSTR